MQTELNLESLAAALLFCAIFLLAGKYRPFRWLVRDERTTVSFGAGVAAAYVFVHVIPELNSAITELPNESKGRFLPFALGGLAYGLILLPLG